MTLASLHPVLSLASVELVAQLPDGVGNAHTRFAERRSLLVVLSDDDGHRGHGEAAPLPGFSDESLADVRAALDALGPTIDPAETSLEALPPSLRFALECALLELRAGERPAFEALLDEASLARVPAALPTQVLLDSLDGAVARARDAFDQGATAFKLKIGRPGEAAREAACLLALRAIDPSITLRVDANGALDPLDAHALAPALAQARVELLEDSVATARLLDDALPLPAPVLPVPLALDDAMARDPHRALTRARALGATHVVLKPTRLGGLERTLHLAARARARGLGVILSHTLEGPVGLAALAHLAFAASASTTLALAGPQGIAPWRGVESFALPSGATLALPAWLGAHRLTRPTGPGLGVALPPGLA